MSALRELRDKSGDGRVFRRHASSHVEFEFKENLVSAWNTRSDTKQQESYGIPDFP